MALPRQIGVGSEAVWGYNDAMSADQIILLVAVLFVLAYVGVLFYVLSMAFELKKKIKSRASSIAVLFAEKKEILSLLDAAFHKSGVSYSKADDAAMSRLSEIDFSKPDSESIQAAQTILKECQNRLNFLAQSNPWATKTPEFQSYQAMLRDLDLNYRQSVAIYNGDVNALNYWRHVPTCYWATRVLGIRRAKPIL